MKIKKRITGLLACGIGAILSLGAGLAIDNSTAAQSALNQDAYFTSAESITVEYGATNTRGESGAKVSFSGVMGKEKISFDYNNYILKEDLSKGFLEIGFLPQEPQVMDFEYMLVTLTDALNEDEKIVWAVAPMRDNSTWWYAHTTAWISYTDNLTTLTGIKYANNPMLRITGTEQNIIGYNNSFLAATHPYYTGKYMEVGTNLGEKTKFFVQETEDSKLDSLEFSLVGAQARIVRSPKNGNSDWMNVWTVANLLDEEFMNKSNQYLVNTPYEQLYSKEYYENLFSSGYCKLNVSFLNCNRDTIECHIEKIGGQKLSDNAECKVENDTPLFEISQDTQAVMGFDYQIPKTVITDMREKDISAKAVYSFMDADGKLVAYDGGDSIRFPQAGKYKMTCSVTLNGGEKFSVTRSVTCFDRMPKTEFSIDASIESAYKTGDEIAVPPPFATNELSTQKNSLVDVLVCLQCEGQTEAVFNEEGVAYYRLEKGGEYVLSYSYQNAYGIVDSVNYAFTVTQSLGIEPQFIPISFVSGRKNEIADFVVRNYVNDVSESEIYRAAYIGNERVFLAKGDSLLEGSYYFNKTLKEDKITLSYKAGFDQNQLIYTEEYEIPIVSTTYAQDYLVVYKPNGQISKEGVTSAFSDQDVSFTATEDFGIKLPQKLIVDSLEVSFGSKDGYSDYQSLDLVLEDYNNSAKRVVFSLREKDATTSYLYVNGVYEAVVMGSLINDKAYFEWTYNEKNACLYDEFGNALTKRVKNWSDGSVFTGFTDGLCVVKLEVSGSEGNVAISLKKVNNQPFYGTKIGNTVINFSDIYAPIIQLTSDFNDNIFKMGEIIKIPSARAYDVLSASSTITVDVINPAGEYIFSGVSADAVYSAIANMFGTWTVLYTAYDEHGLFPAEMRFTFNINDETPPVIYLQGEVAKFVSVGNEYTFPSATVFDNATKNCSYYVIVITPGAKRCVARDNKYTFTESGKYIVQYYAIDDYNNPTIHSYEVYVQ